MNDTTINDKKMDHDDQQMDDHSYSDQGDGYDFLVTGVTMLFGDDLKRALLEQFDIIFSKDYITTDPYLLDNMNPEFYAPISLIEDLPQIKRLTFDTSMIREALRLSNKVILDEENNMVKPTCNLTQRNTIIIRDIPANTPKEDILNLFGNEEKFLSAVAEMKYEYGDNYFVRFSTEEITLSIDLFERSKI